MMFSDEEIKEIPESGFMRPVDEIISIREVCLSDKFGKKESGYNTEPLLSTSRTDLDVPRSLFRDGFFGDGLEQSQARFAWTEEDGNIAALVSEPGFGTTGQTTFGKDLDAAFKSEMKIQSKEVDTSTSVFLENINGRNGLTFSKKKFDPSVVSSTSAGNCGTDDKKSTPNCKVDKEDPRSRFHYVKYVKKQGRTVKMWECGMCGREFQHQYTLMRHLPTHTDERNFHCTACGKSFRQLSTLSQHRAIHSSERPYSCEVCNKTFNRVSTLISHRKTHSNDKPYKCHLCPKGFHQKGNLRNHLFTHTNERPYRCNICFKGFNQQSNLVCHKNKAHPGDAISAQTIVRGKLTPQPTTSHMISESKSESSRPQSEHCEVSSSVGPYPCTKSLPPSWAPKTESWEVTKVSDGAADFWETPWVSQSGVIVDPIKTYHMGVALATKQTPFALLKPENGTPVLVKVVDTKLPSGKQMLVPATAEDLRIGGKIVVNSDNEDPIVQNPALGSGLDTNAVQIRVPVVATVVSHINPGGRLSLTVEEPHHAYHTTLSADVGAVNLRTCPSKSDPIPGHSAPYQPPEVHTSISYEDSSRPGSSISSASVMAPPPPSPPLDLISMDLFEPIDSIPMGPQIIPVDNIDQPPPSDDSDIYIGEFEECIQLSDSD